MKNLHSSSVPTNSSAAFGYTSDTRPIPVEHFPSEIGANNARLLCLCERVSVLRMNLYKKLAALSGDFPIEGKHSDRVPVEDIPLLQGQSITINKLNDELDALEQVITVALNI